VPVRAQSIRERSIAKMRKSRDVNEQLLPQMKAYRVRRRLCSSVKATAMLWLSRMALSGVLRAIWKVSSRSNVSDPSTR
jgi:hypothetical protein